MVLKCANFMILAGKNCFFVSHFWHFKGGLVSYPVPLSVSFPQPGYLFHPSYFKLLKYYQYYQCFTQTANPSKLTKMSLFPTPIILCIKLHFNTGCSLFAGNMLDSCYLLTKHLVYLLPVNTFTYKRSGVHLQNGPNVFQA